MVPRARRETTLQWWLENTGDAHWQDGARVVVLRTYVPLWRVEAAHGDPAGVASSLLGAGARTRQEVTHDDCC
jgi:hypothetical protein